MSASELLQYTNILLVPAMIYIVKLESRLSVLETRLETLLDRLEQRHT